MFGVQGHDDANLRGEPTISSTENTEPSASPQNRMRTLRGIKTQKACETCRSLKIRCIVDDSSPNGACRKCIKNKQACVFLPIQRKRKKRADDRVSELEKKMEQLLTAMEASKKSTPTPERAINPQLTTSDQNNMWTVLDLCDEGILETETAYSYFDFFREKMSIHFPFIVFPADYSPELCRNERPLLFFSIMTVVCSVLKQELNFYLRKEIYAVLGNRVIATGVPSLDVIDAMLIMSVFYSTSTDVTQQRGFNNLIHSIATMSMDAGLGRRVSPKFVRIFRDPSEEGFTRMDPNDPELRRKWVGAYCMCTTVATSLRRQHLVRWNAYMDECIDILENSPDAVPTDKWLCHLARAQYIMEQVHQRFSMDDPATEIPVKDWEIQVKGFDEQVVKWRKGVTPDMPQHLAKIVEGRTLLYIHEISMHQGSDHDDFRPPFQLDSDSVRPEYTSIENTPSHISSMTSCLRAVHQMFDAFLSEDIPTLRTYPIPIFVYMACGLSALFKLSYLVSSPGSHLGSVFTKDDINIEYYLNRWIVCLAEASDRNESSSLTSFWQIAILMRLWWAKANAKIQGEKAPAPIAGPADIPQTSQADLPSTSNVTSMHNQAYNNMQYQHALDSMNANYIPSTINPELYSDADFNLASNIAYDLDMDTTLEDLDFSSQLQNGFEWSFLGANFGGFST